MATLLSSSCISRCVYLAAGQVLALAAGEGAVVDAEGHAHGRLFDQDGRQRPGIVRIGQGIADAHVGDAGHGDDGAGLDLGLGDALQVVEGEDLGHFAGDQLA
jgi:hypothetical protein